MKKETMTVGFVELTNYGRLVKAAGRVKAVEFLQYAFKIAGDMIRRYGGRIHKYIGDSIMFTFSDPRSAISAIEEIGAKKLKDINSIKLEFYAAAATGDVHVSEIEQPTNLVDDLMGSTVSKAAVLLKMALKNEPKIALCPETTKYHK